MNSFTRILLPTEFSPSCERARDHAQLIASKQDAEIDLLHVQVLHDSQWGWSGYPVNPDLEAQIAATAKEHLSRFAQALSMPVTQMNLRDVSASAAILNYADDQAVDLIIMGTHSRKGVSRLFLGSTAAEVVRSAQVPVLVVGRDQPANASGYQCILCPVDFSRASAGALRQAAALAQSFEAQLVVAHVVEPQPVPPYVNAQAKADESVQALAALDALVDSIQLTPRPETLISHGRAFTRINELAREFAADLLVMGTTGLSGLERLLLGSVTERVLRDAPCPVLAHRDPACADER